MSYKTFVSMNIALVGTGAYVENLAIMYVLAGHRVFLAWKTSMRGEISNRLCVLDDVTVTTIEEAAAMGDIIVVACDPKDAREVAYWLGDVRGKVIIDFTANALTGFDDQVNTTGAIRSTTTGSAPRGKSI